jgi:hypothetical protein
MKTFIGTAFAVGLATLALTLSGCAHNKFFGDGKYVAADYDNPTHPDDRFNEYDSRTLILATLDDFKKCGLNKQMVYMVSNIENQTPEMLDMPMLNRELIDQLNNHGFTIVDKSSRPELFDEYKYNETGLVNPALAAVRGKQAGVNYLLRAAIVEKVQQTEDDKTVRYRLSIQAVDTESALVKCTAVTEIKKHFERTRASL